jgi:hypothetical protein
MEKHLNLRVWVSLLSLLGILLFSCKTNNIKSTDDQSTVQYEYIITVDSGNFQQGNSGEPLDNPIVIKITDRQQTPQSDVPLNFEIICGGGRLSLTSTNSNSAGQAEINWVLGDEADQIFKVFSSNNRYAAQAVYVYANTYFVLETQWTSGIPFRMGYRTIPHDDRILESNHFLTFSDASSDDVKIIYSKMAEDAFFELKQDYAVQSSEELGVFSNDSSTKITIFSNKNLADKSGEAFPIGFYFIALDSPGIADDWFGGDEVWLREWYRRTVKHECMHVMQWLFGLESNSGVPWPEYWFSEGIAEYISGGSFTPIETWDQVIAWLQDQDHINPVSVLRYNSSPVDQSRIGEYYPLFGLAVRYLLDEKGLGKTFLDVRAMYLDMNNTKNFRISFERYMGITVEYYEENFFNLIADFLEELNTG